MHCLHCCLTALQAVTRHFVEIPSCCQWTPLELLWDTYKDLKNRTFLMFPWNLLQVCVSLTLESLQSWGADQQTKLPLCGREWSGRGCLSYMAGLTSLSQRLTPWSPAEHLCPPWRRWGEGSQQGVSWFGYSKLQVKECGKQGQYAIRHLNISMHILRASGMLCTPSQSFLDKFFSV